MNPMLTGDATVWFFNKEEEEGKGVVRTTIRVLSGKKTLVTNNSTHAKYF